MNKKNDLPAMPWYWGDWFKCPEVRALTPAARCLWFEMIGLMWESTERGHLTLNGKPYPKEALSRCLGFATDLLDGLLDELETFGVYSKRDDGAIFSRRMVKDEEIRQIRAKAGSKGGFCSSKKRSKSPANHQANTEDENESESETEIEYANESEKAIVKEFIEYRKEIKRPIRSGKSMKAIVKKLRDLSGGDTAKMKAITENSISNGWQGIFPLEKAAKRFGPQAVTDEELRKSVAKSMEIMHGKETNF